MAVPEVELKPTVPLVGLVSYTASDWENGSTGIVKRITWNEIKGFTQDDDLLVKSCQITATGCRNLGLIFFLFLFSTRYGFIKNYLPAYTNAIKPGM